MTEIYQNAYTDAECAHCGKETPVTLDRWMLGWSETGDVVAYTMQPCVHCGEMNRVEIRYTCCDATVEKAKGLFGTYPVQPEEEP